MKVVSGGLRVAAFSLFLAACLGAVPPPAPPRTTNLALQISSSTLPNGLRVVLVRDPKAVEVSVTMRYQVGAVDDPPGHEGMAHLVEHLMFQQILGGQSLFAKLEGITSFFNGFTSLDATTYVARAQRDRLDELLSVEAVRIGFRCTSITDATFVRERAVVLQELKLRDASTELLHAVHAGLYPAGHPYAHRTGGTVDTVGSITREQACAFADAHYATPNAVLVVSGNVSGPELETALGKFIARTARRAGSPPAPVAAPPRSGRRVEAPAPIDDPLILIAWPLPQDPRLRTQLRAIKDSAAAVVDAEIFGAAVPLELGDTRAPMLALLIEPGKDESIEDAISGAKRGLRDLPGLFSALRRQELGEAVFDRIQQIAIYNEFAQLERSDRDEKLAAEVLAGRDPSKTVAEQTRGLREMSRDHAAALAREYLRFDQATVVELKPREAIKQGQKVEVAAPIHDVGQRRHAPDLDEAHRPAPESAALPAGSELTTRKLANGMTVVLMPSTSVPTIDVRLVFGAGTGDEPATKRGAALLAGHGLEWDWRYVNDYLLFVAAGGTTTVDVDFDHTAFSTRGLDMHIDLLLAGLRRWVLNGKHRDYDEAASAVLRGKVKNRTDADFLNDAWRAAMFGSGHPYVTAGIRRHVTPSLDIDDVRAFRATRFTPDNATLVIAGRFDPAVANRWIDYLFADWAGQADPRSGSAAKLQPTAIATYLDIAQVGMSVALPAAAGTYAQRLVAASMLDEIARDVRHQLAASYAINARLYENRLSSTYVLDGAIDAPRTREAVELIRDRIAGLRADPAAAARAFVSARRRVLAQLLGTAGSASALASEIEQDVALGRAPASNRTTAREVASLTLEAMAPALADLELARAAVFLTGPQADLDPAFAALGRTATQVPKVVEDEEDPLTRAAPRKKKHAEESISLADFADPITQGPSSRLRLGVFPIAYQSAKALTHGVSGVSFGAQLGYRFDRTSVVGLSFSVGRLSGTYDTGKSLIPDLQPLEVVPVAANIFLEANSYDRLWGAVIVGLHVNRVTDSDLPPVWDKSIGIGLQGGLDILRLGRHRLGAYARAESELLSEISYAGFVVGLAYRL